jgi:hypothetical protein
MADTYKIFELSENSPTDRSLEPIATVNTLGEALAALDLRAADQAGSTNRFLVQRNDEPPMTIDEIRNKLISGDKVGFRP